MNTENKAQGALRDQLYVIFKHKTKMITIFLTIVVTVTTLTLMKPLVYESKARILVKFGRENVYMTTSPTLKGNPPPSSILRKKILLTQR